MGFVGKSVQDSEKNNDANVFLIESLSFCLVSRWISRAYFRVVAGLNVLSAPGDHVQIRSISAVKMHEDYNDATSDNDVTLVLLSSPFNFTDHVQPICTPHNVTHEFNLNFSHCFISGWGSTYYKGW